jgi:uracil-DNA glycosylase
MISQLQQLQHTIRHCQKCPRLVAWRETIARKKVRRFANSEYWGKPLPGFGDPLTEATFDSIFKHTYSLLKVR